MTDKELEHDIDQAIATAANGIHALCACANSVEGRDYLRKNIRHIDHLVACVQILGSAIQSDKQSNVVPFTMAAE